MDGWDRSLRDDQYPYRRHRESPSFSSTLLDAIYRSIDEAGAGCRRGDGGGEELALCRDNTMRKKQSNSAVKGCGVGGFEDDEDMANLRRACLIEKWMEKKVTEKVVVRRMSVADFERKSRSEPQSVFLKSSSSSSDSSSGGGFSSSETESVNGLPSRSPTLTAAHRPKPIRTSVSAQPEKFTKHGSEFKVFDKCHHQKPKHENGFVKTKSKAMKLYGDLKKAKQPISPGGKLASFLNSLFTTGTSKKAAKISSANNDTITKTKSKSSSTCSSASSFSRSCLSKTPTSRGKSSNGTKRSVRFMDEDNQPCPRKSLYQGEPTLRNSINEELKFLIMEKNQRVEEAARDLLKSYQKKVEYEFLKARNVEEEEFLNDGDEEEDDDAASYESSDLFELDNLSAIGIERYREELPVYETTHLDTNRAIANGLIS